jgi:hypothetical protein
MAAKIEGKGLCTFTDTMVGKMGGGGGSTISIQSASRIFIVRTVFKFTHESYVNLNITSIHN